LEYKYINYNKSIDILDIDKIINNISYNCDFIYNINTKLIIPQLPHLIKDKDIDNTYNNVNVKNLSRCITIRSIKNINEYKIINDIINKNIETYKILTNDINKFNIIDILMLDLNEIQDIFKNIYQFNY